MVYPLVALADLYREQGRYAEAEPLYQRALSICELPGLEHSKGTYSLAYPLVGLANLYREQGKYTATEPLYQRALTI